MECESHIHTQVTHPHNNPASLRSPMKDREQMLRPGQGHTAGLSLIGPPEFPGSGLISWVHWSLGVGDQVHGSTELCFPTCARVRVVTTVGPPRQSRHISLTTSAVFTAIPGRGGGEPSPRPIFRGAWGWEDVCWRYRSFSGRVGFGTQTPDP